MLPGGWAVGDSVPQHVLDYSAGLGDGIINTLTVNIVTGEDVRNILNVNNGINSLSEEYCSGNNLGTLVTTATSLAGAVKSAAMRYGTKKRAKNWRSNSKESRKTRNKKIAATGPYKADVLDATFTIIGGYGVAGYRDVINYSMED